MIRNGLEQRCDELTPYADYRLRKEWISSPLKALLKCPFRIIRLLLFCYEEFKLMRKCDGQVNEYSLNYAAVFIAIG